MVEYDIFVPALPGLYCYPYIAQITGKDARYVFKREFLRYTQVTPSFHNGKWYTVGLPGNGVYEQCIKRKNPQTGEIVGRECSWFIYADGDEVEISRAEVLAAVESPCAVLEKHLENMED